MLGLQTGFFSKASDGRGGGGGVGFFPPAKLSENPPVPFFYIGTHYFLCVYRMSERRFAWKGGGLVQAYKFQTFLNPPGLHCHRSFELAQYALLGALACHRDGHHCECDVPELLPVGYQAGRHDRDRQHGEGGVQGHLRVGPDSHLKLGTTIDFFPQNICRNKSKQLSVSLCVSNLIKKLIHVLIVRCYV